MVNYPAQLDSSLSLPTVTDNLSPVTGATVNRLRDAIIAVETELGTNPSGTSGTIKARLDTIESTMDVQTIVLAADLGNTLALPHVIGIQGRPVSSATPATSQSLAWNGIAWEPMSFPKLAQDLGGTITLPKVIGLQGYPLNSAAPEDGYVLSWNNADGYWQPKAPTSGAPSGSAGGDLSGTFPNPTVGKLQGRTVNSLLPTDGYVLTWDNTDGYWLPRSIPNITANGSASGDLSGTYPSPTVGKLQGRVVNSSLPTDGYVLTWSDSDGYWAPRAASGGGGGSPTGSAGGDLSSTYPNPTVAKLQGNTVNSTAPTDNQLLSWSQADGYWYPKTYVADLTTATGTLGVANGGTGITSFGTGIATFLGTPSGANLATALTTALPDTKGGTGLTSLGTGVATFLGTPSGANLATALTTALPASKGGTGLTSLGTNVATWLGTPSSSNLAAAITDETGSGELVFSTTPTFKTSVKVNNPGNTFAYTITPAAIAADRTLNLPLLLATDTIAVLDFAQTFTNKTLTSPTLGGTPVISGASSSTSNNAKGTVKDVNPVNVQTTDATVTTLDSFTLASNTTVTVSALVTAVKSDNSQAAAYSLIAIFRNNAGTVTQVGTTSKNVIGEDNASWDATIDNSTTTIRIRVTGVLATTIQWTCISSQLSVIP